MRLEAHGIAVELPHGWNGRIFRLAGGGATLHAGTFALALDDSAFGDRSCAAIPTGGAFLSLTEYVPGAGLQPGGGLFASRRMPWPLDPAGFSVRKLAHRRPGQSATQHFFTASCRPLCLYVVIATAPSRSSGRARLDVLNQVLRSVQIAPAQV